MCKRLSDVQCIRGLLSLRFGLELFYDQLKMCEEISSKLPTEDI